MFNVAGLTRARSLEAYNAVNSEGLRRIGTRIYDVWKEFVGNDCFVSFATEDLIPILAENAPSPDWADYVQLRYGGMQ